MLNVSKLVYATAFFLIGLNQSVSIQADVRQLESTIKQLQPFTSQFTQEYYDAFQEKKITSEGLFAFMQPGLMKWVYETPEEMVFIVGKENAWLYDPVLENVTIQSLEKVSGIKSFRFLSGQENISNHFVAVKPKTIYLDATIAGSSAFLTPREKNQALAELQIKYDPNKKRIHQFVLIDFNRNYRKITLTKISTNRDLKESDFEFTVTESMEVIQGLDN